MSDSHSHHKDLQERIDLGVAEAHHRVKNTLQNVISYITIMYAQKDVVHKDDIEKLIRFIRSLASLHDFLRDSDHRKNNAGLIRIDVLLQDIVSLHATDHNITCEDFPPALCTVRRAATLSLIMTELLDNATRFGAGEISVKVVPSSPETLLISVENAINKEEPKTEALSTTKGLNLVKNLARADFGVEPACSWDLNAFKVVLTIPLSESIPAS